MILDQVFFGVLNEKAGTLEVFGEMQSEVGISKSQMRISLADKIRVY